MIDEHTRELLLNIVERSITAELLVAELQTAFAVAGGPPKVLRMDNGPELVSQALQWFCENKTGLPYIPPGCPVDQRLHRIVQQPARSASSATIGTPCSKPAWSSAISSTNIITDTGIGRWASVHQPSTLRHADTPTPPWPARSTESGSNKPDRVGPVTGTRQGPRPSNAPALPDCSRAPRRKQLQRVLSALDCRSSGGSEPIAPVHHCTGMGFGGRFAPSTPTVRQRKPTAHPLHGCGVSLRGSEVAVSFIFTTPQALDNAAKSVSGIHDLWRKGR